MVFDESSPLQSAPPVGSCRAIVLPAAARDVFFRAEFRSHPAGNTSVSAWLLGVPTTATTGEQGGDFTFNFYADGSPVPFATLTMELPEDPGILCENLYHVDLGVSDSATS